jgi:hypothetical protein
MQILVAQSGLYVTAIATTIKGIRTCMYALKQDYNLCLQHGYCTVIVVYAYAYTYISHLHSRFKGDPPGILYIFL